MMDLIINTYGTRVRGAGERIVTFFPKIGKKKEYAARRIRKIIILVSSSISTGAIKLAMKYDIDIVYLDAFGKPIGRFFPSSPKGISTLRRAQLEVSNSEKALDLAKIIVKGKAQNQIDYLKYLEERCGRNLSREIIQGETMLESLNLDFSSLVSKNQLFGIEGYIAERYFSALRKIYKFPGRHARGRDMFNSALNYGYGILYNEIEKNCLYSGLDPNLGLYHSERYGKPSLVLDVIEEFRVPLIDSVIFPLFTDSILNKEKNFKRLGRGAYQLSSKGKKILVEAVYTRLSKKVKWNGKMLDLKDVIKNQVLMLTHYFLGKKQTYAPLSYSVI